MKIVAKNGKQYLKMSHKEWLRMGEQQRWSALENPAAEKVKQVMKNLETLSNDINELASKSGYKFLNEKNNLISIYKGMSAFLREVQKSSTKTAKKDV